MNTAPRAPAMAPRPASRSSIEHRVDRRCTRRDGIHRQVDACATVAAADGGAGDLRDSGRF
eukprot:scaffold3734_cov425-Prasinococcus_capsulatus_cf.AAC.15